MSHFTSDTYSQISMWNVCLCQIYQNVGMMCCN